MRRIEDFSDDFKEIEAIFLRPGVKFVRLRWLSALGGREVSAYLHEYGDPGDSPRLSTLPAMRAAGVDSIEIADRGPAGYRVLVNGKPAAQGTPLPLVLFHALPDPVQAMPNPFEGSCADCGRGVVRASGRPRGWVCDACDAANCIDCGAREPKHFVADLDRKRCCDCAGKDEMDFRHDIGRAAYAHEAERYVDAVARLRSERDAAIAKLETVAPADGDVWDWERLAGKLSEQLKKVISERDAAQAELQQAQSLLRDVADRLGVMCSDDGMDAYRLRTAASNANEAFRNAAGKTLCQMAHDRDCAVVSNHQLRLYEEAIREKGQRESLAPDGVLRFPESEPQQVLRPYEELLPPVITPSGTLEADPRGPTGVVRPIQRERCDCSHCRWIAWERGGYVGPEPEIKSDRSRCSLRGNELGLDNKLTKCGNATRIADVSEIARPRPAEVGIQVQDEDGDGI